MTVPYGWRADPAVPAFPDDRPIIVFDGHCVLCSRFAQFVMRHDAAGRFRLAAAQTPIGSALYRHFGLDPVVFETNILLADGIAYFKSEAAIRIFVALGWPWSLLAAGRILPRVLRDRLYGFVARRRLRWFGTREICFRPDPTQADRFIA